MLYMHACASTLSSIFKVHNVLMCTDFKRVVLLARLSMFVYVVAVSVLVISHGRRMRVLLFEIQLTQMLWYTPQYRAAGICQEQIYTRVQAGWVVCAI